MRIESQLDELWDYAQSIAKEELLDTRPTTFDTTDPQAIRDTIERIDQVLKGKKGVDKKKRQKIAYAKKHYADAVDRYNKQEQIMQSRNSYSKTDPDATFMHMKEDHMRNGQTKPGYNVQISTNNQIITNYSIHQNPGDPLTLIPHLESFEKTYGFMPEELTADAGYGSYSNYEYLVKKGITPYVKYALFNKEIGQKKSSSSNTNIHQKQAKIAVTSSPRERELKEYVTALLLSEKGIIHRKKRGVEVESVFGMLKENRGFRRFKLSGLSKVGVEFGLLALAHNLSKLAKILMLEDFFRLCFGLRWFYSLRFAVLRPVL